MREKILKDSINLEKLIDCKTKEDVESYFVSIKIKSTSEKIDALSQALKVKSINYFADEPLEKQYSSLLNIFLNKEIRWLKGL